MLDIQELLSEKLKLSILIALNKLISINRVVNLIEISTFKLGIII